MPPARMPPGRMSQAARATRPANEAGNRSPRRSPRCSDRTTPVPSRLYRQQKLGTPVSFRGCRVYSTYLPDWLLNVALVAAAETVSPWELRVSPVILRVGGTPL